MAGLLYKDLYVVWKNNRMLLLMALIFLVLGGLEGESMFFILYPPLVLTALGMSSLAYDERSKWLQYADALPYGRRKLVASKYLLSAMACGVCVLLTVVFQLWSGAFRGGLDPAGLILLLGAVVLVSTVQAVILLPVSFRFGTEKSRFVYLICLGGFGAASFMLPVPGYVLPLPWPVTAVGLGIIAGCAVLWVASYLLAAKLYAGREL